MATVKQPVGTRTALTVTGLSALANGSTATSSTKDNTANQPVDLLVELTVTTGTVAGNKQALLYALASLDGVNWSTALRPIGSVPCPTSAARASDEFGIALQYGGSLPPYLQFVVLNDSGAAFTAGTIFISEINPTVV